MKEDFYQQDVQRRMLKASEFFHYAYKFRSALFLLVIEQESLLQEIMLDLRVLLSSHVPCALIFSKKLSIGKFTDRWNTQGFTFRTIKLDNAGDLSRVQLSQSFEAGEIPLIECNTEQLAIDSFCVELVSNLGGDKVFFFVNEEGLLFNGEFKSHPSIEEVQNLVEGTNTCNVSKTRVSSLLQAQLVYGFETVFLQAKAGSLFQEIFTYRGSGTLITDNYPNILRKATATDIADISFLMKPAVEQGLVLPVSEDELVDTIDSFYVFTVDQTIVAVASLKDYGEAAELGRICTLPRYQGKGRARQLSVKLVEEAKKQGKKYVFSLSTEPMMWEFFKSLGFEECERQALPSAWQKSYDKSRISKALIHHL